jgi:hypothetical protein
MPVVQAIHQAIHLDGHVALKSPIRAAQSPDPISRSGATGGLSARALPSGHPQMPKSRSDEVRYFSYIGNPDWVPQVACPPVLLGQDIIKCQKAGQMRSVVSAILGTPIGCHRRLVRPCSSVRRSKCQDTVYYIRLVVELCYLGTEDTGGQAASGTQHLRKTALLAPLGNP